MCILPALDITDLPSLHLLLPVIVSESRGAFSTTLNWPGRCGGRPGGRQAVVGGRLIAILGWLMPLILALALAGPTPAPSRRSLPTPSRPDHGRISTRPGPDQDCRCSTTWH
ncbi:MAG: hypothetical protein ABI140_09940 [Jatrophihabitantaceae bacterium]